MYHFVMSIFKKLNSTLQQELKDWLTQCLKNIGPKFFLCVCLDHTMYIHVLYIICKRRLIFWD